MHIDEIDIPLHTAQRLIYEQFPRLAGLPVSRLDSSGTVNVIFRVGRHLAARFPLRDADPLQLEQRLHEEAAASARMALYSPVPVPVPQGIGAPGHGFPLPWSLQSWIPGSVATSTSLADSIEFADDLASLIMALRSGDTEGETFKGSNRGGNLLDHDGWVSECLDRSEELLNTAFLGDLWSRYRLLPDSHGDALCHSDLIPANVLTDGRRLTGILDAGGFGAADASLDLVAGWHMLAAEAREHLRALLNSDDVEWERGKAWAFEQAIGAVWYYLDSNPRMFEMGVWTLRRIVEDETGDTGGLAPGSSRVWDVFAGIEANADFNPK